ncbi:hypothetical protein [Streptacidiphilus sp. PAMC 29251]
MERLELLVVQLEETKRLIEVDRVPQLRLAFILLDNAAEVILHRSTESALFFQATEEGLLTRLKEMEAAGHSNDWMREQMESLEKSIVPKRRLKEIERNFDAKVEFMVSRDQLPGELAPVLAKLHKYRNETYHRDTLRRELIRPAVLIYFDVICSMLGYYSQGMLSYSSNTVLGPEVERFQTEAGPISLFGVDLAKKIAKQLRKEVGLDIEGTRQALSAHLIARLDDLDKHLKFIEDNLGAPGLVPGDALRIVQADLSGLPTLEQVRSRKYRYGKADLQRWRTESAGLDSIDDKAAMFTAYAAIEDDFEPLEVMVESAVTQIDRQMQLDDDIARGK